MKIQPTYLNDVSKIMAHSFKRALVFSDVHGNLQALLRSLTLLHYNSNEDLLISCGDNFDRGQENCEMRKFMMKHAHDAIWLRGNHENMLRDLIERGYPMGYDVSNGTAATLSEFDAETGDTNYHEIFVADELPKLPNATAVIADRQNVVKMVNDMPHWITMEDFIFTHGWIPHTLLEDAYEKEWENAEFCNTRNEFSALRYNDGTYNIRLNNKTLVVGHWDSEDLKKMFMNYSKPFQYDGAFLGYAGYFEFSDVLSENNPSTKVIVLDGCTTLTDTVPVLVLPFNNVLNIESFACQK
jgi:hypothetical protein